MQLDIGEPADDRRAKPAEMLFCLLTQRFGTVICSQDTGINVSGQYLSSSRRRCTISRSGAPSTCSSSLHSLRDGSVFPSVSSVGRRRIGGRPGRVIRIVSPFSARSRRLSRQPCASCTGICVITTFDDQFAALFLRFLLFKGVDVRHGPMRPYRPNVHLLHACPEWLHVQHGPIRGVVRSPVRNDVQALLDRRLRRPVQKRLRLRNVRALSERICDSRGRRREASAACSEVLLGGLGACPIPRLGGEHSKSTSSLRSGRSLKLLPHFTRGAAQDYFLVSLGALFDLWRDLHRLGNAGNEVRTMVHDKSWTSLHKTAIPVPRPRHSERSEESL